MAWLLILVSLASIDDDPELSQACYTAVEQSRTQLSRSSFQISEKLEWPAQVPPRIVELEGQILVTGHQRHYSWRMVNDYGGEVSIERVKVFEDGDDCILARVFEDEKVSQKVPELVSVFFAGVQPRIDPFVHRTPDLLWFTDHVLEYRHIARHLQGPPVSRVNGKPYSRDVTRTGNLIVVQLVFPLGFEATLTFSLDHGGNMMEYSRKEPPQGARTSWIYSKRTYQWEQASDGTWWPERLERRETKDSESGELIFSDTVEVKEFLGILEPKGSTRKSVSLKDLGELKPGTMVTEYRLGAKPKSYTVGKEKTENFEETARSMGNSLRQGSLYKARK
jgi:hypothetical protein